MPDAPVLEIRDLAKRYSGGVDALGGVALMVEEGELLAVVGPSGSGKSTLLHIMGTLDRPSAQETEGVVALPHDVTLERGETPARRLASS